MPMRPTTRNDARPTPKYRLIWRGRSSAADADMSRDMATGMPAVESVSSRL